MPVFEVTDGEASQVVTAVKFSHGDPMRVKGRSQMTWQFYRQKKSNAQKGKEKRIVTAKVDDMTYVGKNFGASANSSADSCDYYMGVLDKTTGKMRVLPAQLFHLEPWFEESETIGESNADKSYRDKTDDLTKEFGSGRNQRAVLKRQRNKLDEEMLSVTTKSVAETSIVQEEASGKAGELIVTETSAVPPHNKEASRPEDVYKLKDIISPEIMGPLSEQCQALFNGTKEDIEAWTREKAFPQFILNKLSTLSVREDARLLQCQCLIYLNCLMKMFVMKHQQIRLKDPLPSDWKFPIKKHILNQFTLETVENGRKRRQFPGRLKDLMLSHILVLCLKLSSFQVNLNTLLADLNVARKRLITHSTILGCTVKSAKNPAGAMEGMSYIASLSIPLKFPELKMHSKKSRFM
ncbi:DNA-directed RNA polymerase I subunit RPA49 [Aplysia californica]|uniref:DNA-directed RNA polymerase I subunit RPA49 n=1 Tax=Aplysia californica TaxID=6500 RepID=A0ABM0JSY7_APLCA|nr:DNA-directed RNA polymerase I subunit RPA49 [Aplysia californica]